MKPSQLYNYHGGAEHARRLGLGICRCASKGVVYDLAECLVDGRLRDPRNFENLFSTPSVRTYFNDPMPDGSGYGKTFIFAVSVDYRVHVAPDSERKHPRAVKHETLFENADVLAAGEIALRDGVIEKINDLSGSYDTKLALENNPAFATAVLRACKLRDLPLTTECRALLTMFSQP